MNFAGVQSVTIPEGDVKSIAIGGVTVWTKPNPLPYDAEVDYVESTGTQYIDTGIVPTNTMGFSVSVMRLSNLNINNTAIGATGIVDGSYYRFGAIMQSNQIRGLFGPVVNTGVAPTDGTWYTIRVNYGNDRLLTVNGVTKATLGTTSAIQETITVFAYNVSGDVSYNLHGRISALDITDGSTLVRSFVPVRVGQVGYLYDRANPSGGPLGNGLYGNAGTGAFTVGPDKNGA